MIVVAACWLADAAPSQAQKQTPRASGRAPTAAEFATLKQQVEAQNELIKKLADVENAHYQLLLKLLRNEKPGTPALVIPEGTTPPSGEASPPPPPPQGAEHAKTPTATITGRVDVKGKPWGSIYVYLDNPKDAPVDRSAEVWQRDRSFVPNVLVVQRGTRVTFPNADPFLHNVFSPGPAQPFDLGSYKQGEKPGSVRLFSPGVIEVLCNMHAKMRANVLVVPNHHHVKVGADGSFRLENVPVGARQLVAWTPDARPVTESVTLTTAGANVKLALQVGPPPPPIDKDGKPRSGYRQEE